MRPKLFVFAFLSLVTAGCGFRASAPVITPPPEAPAPPVSTLNVEMRLKADDIGRLLNEKTTEQIAHIENQPVRCPLENCELNLIATRNGPIAVRVVADRLTLDAPFSFQARFGLKLPFAKGSADANGEGRLQAATAFSVAPDWSVKTKTQGNIRFSQVGVQLGPVRMQVGNILNDTSDQISRPMFNVIDKQLGKDLGFQKQVARLWAKMQEPIQVSKNPEAWLVLAPSGMTVHEPTGEGNALVVGLGLEMRAHVVVSSKPDGGPLSPLPAAQTVRDRAKDRFQFVVPVVLPYGEATQLAAREVGKHPIRVGRSTEVRISDLSIVPSHDDVVIAARFCVSHGWDLFHWFDSCGRGYLRGAPEFDAATDTLKITKVAYDAGTANALIGLVGGVLGLDLTAELQKDLMFDLSDRITKLRSDIEAAIAKPEGKDLIISGKMEAFEASSLNWTKDSFIVSLSAAGTVHALLRE